MHGTNIHTQMTSSMKQRDLFQVHWGRCEHAYSTHRSRYWRCRLDNSKCTTLPYIHTYYSSKRGVTVTQVGSLKVFHVYPNSPGPQLSAEGIVTWLPRSRPGYPEI